MRKVFEELCRAENAPVYNLHVWRTLLFVASGKQWIKVCECLDVFLGGLRAIWCHTFSYLWRSQAIKFQWKVIDCVIIMKKFYWTRENIDGGLQFNQRAKNSKRLHKTKFWMLSHHRNDQIKINFLIQSCIIQRAKYRIWCPCFSNCERQIFLEIEFCFSNPSKTPRWYCMSAFDSWTSASIPDNTYGYRLIF